MSASIREGFDDHGRSPAGRARGHAAVGDASPCGETRAAARSSSAWTSSPQSVGGPRAGETRGGSSGSPRCLRIFRIGPGSVAHRDLSGIEAIGVDEIQRRSGHTYLTLVYQIDGMKRLLWVAQERTEQSLRGFFNSLTAKVRQGIRFVCSDMWRQCLNVIAEQIPAALHVLDRFHIMRNMNMALDEVRRAEIAQLRRDGYEPILTKARWCLLERIKQHPFCKSGFSEVGHLASMVR